MYAPLEASLRTAVSGAVRSAQVFGTLEFVDFASEEAPPIAVRVVWQGFTPDQRKQDVLRGTHRFAVEVVVVSIRVKPAERAAVSDGLLELHRRLIAWRPRPEISDFWADIESAGVTEDGQVWRYQINLSVPGYVIRPEQ